MSNNKYLVKYKIQKSKYNNVFVYKINNVICIHLSILLKYTLDKTKSFQWAVGATWNL